MIRTISSLATIAYRDLLKLMRDKPRIVMSFVFPLLFIGALGGSLQANLSEDVGYNFLTFVFTGVLAQTLFQSTAAGIISLIEDRVNDFSQEIFIAPISRYTIILGKIIGEMLVSFTMIIGILAFGVVIGVPLGFFDLIKIFGIGVIAALFGGAFGVLVLANLSSERTANQVFPLIIFPQLFLAGVFNPIKKLPLFLDILSRISPMRYAVDLLRGVYYWGRPEYGKVVVASPAFNMLVISVLFFAFLTTGTFMFVRNERNK
jgi:ABC-2 type transport system permease protein